MKSDKINIRQIAELSGVSVATVSRVINQNGRFSKETERRVRAVIEQNNYMPNGMAKALRTSHMPAVGVVVPDILNNHFARLLLALEKRLFAIGYSTIICNTDESAEIEAGHMRMLAAQQVVGVILISGRCLYQMGDGLPVIYLDRRPEGLTQDTVLIESDNEAGGYMAANSLIGQGCQRIGIVLSSHLDSNHNARLQGFRRALSQAGLSIDPELVIDTNSSSFETARCAVAEVLQRGKRPDGLVCTTDELAVGSILGARDAGKAVPDDIMVVGFDDSSIAEAYNPPISSMHQDIEQMAEYSIEVLKALMKGEELKQRQFHLPTYLVERTSGRRKS